MMRALGPKSSVRLSAGVRKPERRRQRIRVVAVLLSAAVVAGAFVLLMAHRSAEWQLTTRTLAAAPGSGQCASCGTHPSTLGPNSAAQGTRENFPPLPPGAIDGAKNPELIPGNVAYKMLFLSLLEPADAKLANPARQQAKLKMIDLSADDQAIFLAVLNDFQRQMSDLGAQTAEILKATPSPERDSVEWLQLADIEEQSNTLVTDTVEALNARLTPEGFAKLQARLLDFKHTIKAFPMPKAAVAQ